MNSQTKLTKQQKRNNRIVVFLSAGLNPLDRLFSVKPKNPI
jgi:hypothetical protein